MGIAQIKNTNKEFKNYLTLENIVYNELLVRNYEVYVGHTNAGEVDFVVKKDGNIKYIQVTYSLEDETTREREFNAFLPIKDNHPKYIISLDKLDYSRDGIKNINLINFLMNEDF